jgi:hypothetical protein
VLGSNLSSFILVLNLEKYATTLNEESGLPLNGDLILRKPQHYLQLSFPRRPP